MKFDIATNGRDGDIHILSTVNWPMLPRVGDVIYLTGLVRRGEDTDVETREKAKQYQHSFTVDSIIWVSEVSGKTPREDPEVQVFVRPNDVLWDETDYV